MSSHFKFPAVGLVVLNFLLFFAAPLAAHQKGESYVFFSVSDEALTGRFEAILDDIDRMVPLDADANGEISEAEFTAKSSEIFDFFQNRLSLGLNGTDYAISFDSSGVLETPAGTFGQISFTVPDLNPTPDAIDVQYQPMTDAEFPDHGGYGIIENNTRTGVENNESHIALIFKPGDDAQSLNLVSDPWGKIFVEFVWEGMLHIWIGIDHILFLFTLLLPAVLLLNVNRWEPVDDFKTALINVVKIATVFTISHSITLSIAALGIFTLPVTLVEAVIAASIAVVAFGNMFPIFHHRVLLVVFIFGLFHGFGFANVLEPLGLVPSAKAIGLLAFNIGVELGQIAIIIVLFPILFALRKWSAYPMVALKVASVAIILVSMFWFFERSADSLMKFQSQLFAMAG